MCDGPNLWTTARVRPFCGSTTTWNITWAANGHHGTLVTDYTGTRTLEVGELQSLIIG